MAWYTGAQKTVSVKDFNEEVKQLTGTLNDVTARITLAKFLRYNLGFMVYLFTKIKLEPIQELILKAMLYRDNGIIVAGRGSSKSFLLSVFALLYPIFHFNSKLCIISANFRRSRAILEECDKWINNKENFLLKQCFPDSLRKGNDIFRLKIPSPANSEVFALPLTSGSGGDGLRGTRASCVCVDEGLLITKDIQELVIRPFLTAKQDFSQESMIRAREDELIAAGVITEADRISFPKNKYHILSSASYKFEYLYELYQSIIENIENPPAVKDEKDRPSYFAIRMSYEAIPKGSFMDYTQIEAAKTSIGENSEYFKREYKALFSDASDSYFNVKKLQDCTIKVGNFPTTQIIGDKNSSYILTIDPSYSASKSSDFFAMGVYLVNFDERKITLVHTYGRAGGELKDHYDYFTFLLTQFNIIFCAIDASGTEFISGYNESVIAKDKNIKLGFIDANLDEEEPRAYIDEIKKAKNQYNQSSKTFIYAQKFHSMSIRHMNESLHNQISAEKVWFGSKCQANKQAFERYIEVKLPFKYTDKNGEKIDDNSATAEMIYEQDEWIDETKAQLGLIEVKATSQGTLQYDLPQELRRDKSVNRARRDNYTCLLMANWAAKIYFDMFFTKLEAKKTEMFAPTLI